MNIGKKWNLLVRTAGAIVVCAALFAETVQAQPLQPVEPKISGLRSNHRPLKVYVNDLPLGCPIGVLCCTKFRPC